MPQEAAKPSREPIQFGKYKVLVRIGKGGMGTVYKAVDTDLDRVVALKIMAPEIAAKPNMLQRFRQEARSAARLRHDNIVAIFDFGEVQGTWYLALEYVDGRDLQRHISRQGKLDPAESRELTLQAARALEHAHEQGIIHRDIKPSNFLLTVVNGKPLLKLTDMGLALHQEEEQARITKDHATVGTVDYMPPEQAYDSRASDIRSDIYSLGCTLYHMLAGHGPFPKGSIAERVIGHLKKDPPDIRTLNDRVPDDLAAILQKMMAKKPADRYQTPADLIADLEAGFRGTPPAPVPERKKPAKDPEKAPETAIAPPSSGETTRARKKKRSSPETRKVRKNSRPAWVVPAIAASVVLILGGIVWWASRPGADPDPSPIVKGPETPPAPPILEKKADPPPPIEPKKKPKDFVGPKAPILRPPLAARETTVALHKRFFGSLAESETVPVDAAVKKCRRAELAGDGFSGFEKAFAEAAPGSCTILEIHDDGPFFLGNLPEVKDRHVVLRAGPGFRPLLVWDGGSSGVESKPDTIATLFRVRQGRLDLVDLDFVVGFVDAKAGAPRSLVLSTSGILQARRCTFSQGGKALGEAALIRTRNLEDSKTGVPSLVRLAQCHVRGSEWAVLQGEGDQEMLVEDSLVVGGSAPLVTTQAPAGTTTLRLARSTLVAEQDLLAVRGEAPGRKGLRLFAWDTLLARCAPLSPSGDLLRLDGPSDLVEGSIHNVLYAGWKRMLHAPERNILPGALDQWRKLWTSDGGDGESIETWPPQEPTAIENVPAIDFKVAGTFAAYGSTGGAGPLGCAIDLLPVAPTRWETLTHQPRAPMDPHLPELEDPPTIPPTADGIWHGERVDVGKTDLGQLLAQRLAQLRPGPRVILHLQGKGTVQMRPLKVRGIPHLVLIADRAGTGRDPLILQVRPAAATDGNALIEVEGGHLDLLNLRVVLPNERTAPMPPHLIRVQGGSLRAKNCRLDGPTTLAPDYFRSLLDWKGNGPDGYLVMEDSVLACGKPLVQVRGDRPRILLRDVVLLGGEDGFRFDPSEGPLGEGWCRIDNATVALKGSLWHLPPRSAARKVTVEPFLVRTERCWFPAPYPPPPAFGLLRASSEDLVHFPLQWQGYENGYELEATKGLLRVDVGKPVPGENAWRRFWGPMGDRAAITVPPPAKKSGPFTLDRPDWARLIPPPSSMPLVPRLGANLRRLDLPTGK